MIRRFTLVAGLSAAAILPAHAAHDALSYSHFDFAYLGSSFEQDGSSDSLDGDGFRIGGGVGLARWVNFVGEYDQRRFDDLGGGDFSLAAAGLGVHTRHPDYQFQLEGTWERYAQDFPTQENDDVKEGYGVAAGVRVPLSSLELHASYKYMDYDDVETGGTKLKFDGQRIRGGVALQLSPWWSLLADYRQVTLSVEDDDSTFTEWTVGFRRYFPTDADPRKRHGGVLFGDAAEDEAPKEAQQ